MSDTKNIYETYTEPCKTFREYSIDKCIIFDFYKSDGDVNNVLVGQIGRGKSIMESLEKKYLLNNNYRKSHKMPLVRKGHPLYKIIKSYKRYI